jgi:UDP-glucuronate 4-epimerase
MSNIIVTGGAGFLGTHISRKLSQENSVTVLDRVRKDFGKTEVEFVLQDIMDADRLAALFNENSYDTVVHLAARSDVRDSIENAIEFERINVRGTLNVLEAARASAVKKVIFASSSSVYGNAKNQKISEDDNTDDHASPYGATKKMGEIFCSLYHTLYGIDATALRFFTIYGPGGRTNMAIMRFIKNIDQAKPIDVHGMGKISRDFLYVDDAVEAVEMALAVKTGFEAINIGVGKPHDLDGVIGLIEKSLGKQARKNYMPMQKGDVMRTEADVRKAERILGWRPRTSLEEGIDKTVNWWNAGGKKLYDD